MKKLALVSALGVAGLLATPAWAESTFVSPAAAASTATARLDFSVVIPQVLFLRVGTSAGNTATTATVDGIVYTVAAANIGNGTAVAGVGGDLTGGAVTVRVYGNGGNITLNSGVTGALVGAAATDLIPWSNVTVTGAALAAATAGYTNAAIAHPAFNLAAAGGAGTATTLTATNKVVRVEGRWTYAYANTGIFGAGTYGGTVAKNGRVTYTATQL